jgi:site-specific DNA-methyltransferase (adenine-specific)
MTDLQIENVAIDSLTPDSTNARKHDSKNLDAIAGSLKLFGQRKPIVVTPDNVVVAGNGTLQAAKQLGWSEIVIARTPRGWTWEQIKAFALADNRTAELAEWDSEILKDQMLELDAVGWDIAEFGFEPLQPPIDTDWTGALDSLGGDRQPIQQMTFTLHDDQVEQLKIALAKSRAMGAFIDTGNPNDNGNALARIVETFNGSDL